MTILTNLTPAASYPDLLTTTNNGNGLTTTLEPVQDGLGNSSPMQIATNAVNFDRTGNTFQLDGVALTATATNINEVCQSNSHVESLVVIGQISYFFVPSLPPVNTSFNILVTDNIVGIGTNFTMDGQTITAVLPNGLGQPLGRMIYVKDLSGTVTAARTIIVNVTGGGTIDGAANYTLTAAYQCEAFITDGISWYTLSRN